MWVNPAATHGLGKFGRGEDQERLSQLPSREKAIEVTSGALGRTREDSVGSANEVVVSEPEMQLQFDS